MTTKDQLLDILREVGKYTHHTPVLTSRHINSISGAELYFKCENFQRMGAFKMRGAINAVQKLNERDRKKGVVTHSSGNFAQALSLAAKNLGIPAYIVMPTSAPEVKKQAVKSYGGRITLCPPTLTDREETAGNIISKTGASFIHPSDNSDVINGNATAGIEFFKDYPELELIIAPVGGGGLLAGTALAAKYFSQNAGVIGAEPFEADDAYRSFQSGKIEGNTTTNTIADGLKTVLGEKNFPIIKELVREIIRVQEAEIIPAMRLIWERMKIIVEPSSAVALAGVLREKEKFKEKKVGIILSGGNVDLQNLPF